MKNIIYLLFVCLILISCQSNETNKDEQTSESMDSKIESTPVDDPGPVPSFVLDNFIGDGDVPQSIVSLLLNNQKIELEKAIGCKKIDTEDYDQYQIPNQAIEACGGWWAGTGNYFYLIKDPNKDFYNVMRALVDEQQEGTAYKYENIMTITGKTKR